MTDVIFALPRTDYGSYQDLYRLIELAEFPTVYLDEIDPTSDTCYIMTVANGENAAGWQSPRARIILWDFEWRPDGRVSIPGLAEYWHMDAHAAAQLGARYVPVGGDARLGEFDANLTIVPRYDVAYLGYMIPRRQAIGARLSERGVRLSPTSSWGVERAQVLMSSTTYLHVHQLDQAPGVPALRMVVAAAYQLPVIAETFADPGIFDGYTLQSVYEHLPAFAAMWAKEPCSRLRDYALSLNQLLCHDLTFRRSVEVAL